MVNMSDKKVSIKFLGAVRSVTGSSFLLSFDGASFLIDCGMFQERHLRYRNWEQFSFNVSTLNAVLLTHAHLDHCGLLPRLVLAGFKGQILATQATIELAKIVLQDSAKLQAEDAALKAKRHKKENRKAPFPEVPLYTLQEVEAVFPHFKALPEDSVFELVNGLFLTLLEAGHIIGSSMIRFKSILPSAEAIYILFSGDIGRKAMPLVKDPASCSGIDYAVIESTYGNRAHTIPERDIAEALAEVINRTAARGGKIVIPAFAIERSQEIIYHLNNLFSQKKIPQIPVFLDSPMANKVTDVFKRHPELLDDEAFLMLEKRNDPYSCKNLVITSTPSESKKINSLKKPAIIIAGSGMCAGGRIKHHLVHSISERENTILFVGYQASGTLGREILDGKNPVRIFGEYRTVRAEVARINGFSAHADYREIIEWLESARKTLKQIFVVHGDEDAAGEFARKLIEKGFKAVVPMPLEEVQIL
jgi:metallo-beta-lactamase family protein